MNKKRNHSLKRFLLFLLFGIALAIYLILAVAFAVNELSYTAGNDQHYSFIFRLTKFLHIQSSDFCYQTAIDNEMDKKLISQMKLIALTVDDRKIYLFTEAAIANPLDYLSRYELANLLWRHGYSNEIILKLLQDSLYIYPMKDKLWMALALFYISTGEIQLSLNCFKKAIEIKNENLPFIYAKLQFFNSAFLREVTPRNYNSFIYLAEYHVQRKENRQAAEAFKEAFSFADFQNKIEIIKNLMNIQEYEMAHALLDSISYQMKDTPDYHWLIALYYIHKGASKEFSKEMDTAMKLASLRFMPGSPEMNDFLINIGYTFLSNFMTNTAKIYFSKALFNDSYNTRAFAGISQCYYEEGDMQKAFFYARQIEDTAVNYQYILSIFKMALTKNNHHVVDEILTYLKDKKATESWWYAARALFLKNQGNYVEAISSIESALNLEPDNDVFLKEAGAICTLFSDYPSAIKYYERLISLYPMDASASAELIKIFIKQEDIDKARSLCIHSRNNGIVLSECQTFTATGLN